MDTSVLIAKVMGIFMLVGGVSALMNKDAYKKAVKEYSKSFILVAFDASIALMLGALFVAVHNVWVADFRGLITLFGWLMLVEGAFALLFPSAMQGFAKSVGKSGFTFFSFVMLLVGAYLTYVGFLA